MVCLDVFCAQNAGLIYTKRKSDPLMAEYTSVVSWFCLKGYRRMKQLTM